MHRVLHAHPAIGFVTKIVVALLGGAFILAGFVMLFTPGQGILSIILGLAILSTEFEWAERLLQRARARYALAKARAKAVDPKVRRRRLMLWALALAAATALVVWYVAAYGWPGLIADGWDWVQGLFGWLPDLPGM